MKRIKMISNKFVHHILISNYDSSNKKLSDEQIEENKKTAEAVLKMALDGDDFATLAKEYSDDSSASSGGDLGYFTEDEMVSAFSKAAFSLKIDEIYPEVVETSAGYHIIKKTGEKVQDFDDVKDDLISLFSFWFLKNPLITFPSPLKWPFTTLTRPSTISMETMPPVIFAMARKGMLYWNRVFRSGTPAASLFFSFSPSFLQMKRAIPLFA